MELIQLNHVDHVMQALPALDAGASSSFRAERA